MKNENKNILSFTVLNFKLLLAQPGIQWQKSLGGSLDEDSFGIAKTSDRSSIVVGTSTSLNGDEPKIKEQKISGLSS